MLFLIAPYKQVVDSSAIAAELCSENYPKLQVLGVKYTISLPDDLCSQPPQRWMPLLRGSFEEAGVVADRSGACDRSIDAVRVKAAALCDPHAPTSTYRWVGVFREPKRFVYLEFRVAQRAERAVRHAGGGAEPV